MIITYKLCGKKKIAAKLSRKIKNRIRLSMRSEGGERRTYRIDDRKLFSNLYNLRYSGYKFRQAKYINNNSNLKFAVRK